MPYAQASNDVYGPQSSLSSDGKLERLADWETLLREGGVSNAQILAFKLSGFYASAYRNNDSGEIVIAFRGTETRSVSAISDIGTDIDARFSPSSGPPPQYVAASELTRIASNKWGKDIALTGHSLGGGLASYAGETQGISKVYTFNAARNPLSTQGDNANQINIVVPGELIGDAVTDSTVFGTQSLPGRTYNLNTTDDQTGLFGGHAMRGIIGGLISLTP
jgi:hypothetical protein